MSKKLFVKGKNKVSFLIDDEDLEEIKKRKWYLLKSNTARTNYIYSPDRKGKVQRTLFLHRLITGASKGYDVDHINGNGLDNRKENLRVCTRSQNKMNIIKNSNKISSKYKGVYPIGENEKRKQGWRAAITLDGKMKTIGRYYTEKEAALAYNAYAKEIFGEFAKINKIVL